MQVKWSVSICVALILPFSCLHGTYETELIALCLVTQGDMLNSPLAVSHSTEGPVRLHHTVDLSASCEMLDVCASLRTHILSPVGMRWWGQ